MASGPAGQSQVSGPDINGRAVGAILRQQQLTGVTESCQYTATLVCTIDDGHWLRQPYTSKLPVWPQRGETIG